MLLVFHTQARGELQVHEVPQAGSSLDNALGNIILAQRQQPANLQTNAPQHSKQGSKYIQSIKYQFQEWKTDIVFYRIYLNTIQSMLTAETTCSSRRFPSRRKRTNT
eukprot:GHVU01039390.1.p1 GENE.GHVU01039390.1~~GHVU01039390.1.p1  ORF type:complete len:107 (+),score=10.88 GHVU01039390.1:204-524(+)